LVMAKVVIPKASIMKGNGRHRFLFKIYFEIRLRHNIKTTKKAKY